MGFQKELSVAREAALQAGNGLKPLLGRVVDVRKKGEIDLVTEADLQAEQTILQTIRLHFPRDGVLTEETGQHQALSERLWIIDPVDGTINLAHGLPFYAVCIGLQVEGRLVMGVVFNPVTNEVFEAVDGKGALLNGTAIRVSRVSTLVDSLVATGFPYSVHEESETVVQRFHQVLIRAQALRRLGSAALDLCYVAAGRFEAFWEQGLKPWDTAAATVIVKEAGGRLTDYDGNPFSPSLSTVVASNGLVHQAMLDALNAETSS